MCDGDVTAVVKYLFFKWPFPASRLLMLRLLAWNTIEARVVDAS